MNIQNIKTSKEVLEHLLSYSVQYVPVGNMVANSSPSEKLETTYNNFSRSIQDLTPEIFYKTISYILSNDVDAGSFVNDFAIGKGHPVIKEKIQNTIQVMNIQLFMESI